VNSLPKTVTRQRGDCDLNSGPSAPESSTLTTRLPSHPHAMLARNQMSLVCPSVRLSQVGVLLKVRMDGLSSRLYKSASTYLTLHYNEIRVPPKIRSLLSFSLYLCLYCCVFVLLPFLSESRFICKALFVQQNKQTQLTQLHYSAR